MNTSIAQSILNDIKYSNEISRLRRCFMDNPNKVVETSLTLSEAEDAGFITSSSYQGVFVQLLNANKSQYGDH